MANSITKPRQQSGFTLTELIITLALIGILLALAIPSFESLIASSRISTTTNDFHAALAQARSEAVRRGQRVTVCVSANGIQCTNAGSWEQGWITFVDVTRAGVTANVDPLDTILQASTTRLPGILVQGQPAVAQYVSFASDGQSRTMTGGVQTGTIEICSTSQALQDASNASTRTRARDLVLNASGQVIMRTVDAAGTPLNIPNNCPPPP